MTGGYRAGVKPIYHHLKENNCDGWRDVLLGAARAVDDLTPETPELAQLRRLTIPLDSPTGELDAAVMGAALTAFEGGVLLGYALARTWPDSPEGFDDWAARAIALAGLPTG